MNDMDAVRRHTVIAGGSALALLVAAIIAAGMPPLADAGAGAVSAFVTEQRASILLVSVLYQLAIPALFVFFAGLARLCAGAEGEATALAWGGFAGGVGLQAVAIAGGIPFIAAAWRGADEATLRLTYDTNLLAIYPLTAGLSIASVLLPTLAGLKTRTLPLWIVLPAVVLVAANVAELAGFLFYDSGFMAMGAGPGLLAVPAWTAWLACVSVALLVTRR